MSTELKELESILKITIPENLVQEVVKVEEGHFDILCNVKNAYNLMKILHEDAGIYHLSTVFNIGWKRKLKKFQLILLLQRLIKKIQSLQVW